MEFLAKTVVRFPNIETLDIPYIVGHGTLSVEARMKARRCRFPRLRKFAVHVVAGLDKIAFRWEMSCCRMLFGVLFQLEMFLKIVEQNSTDAKPLR